MKSLNCCSLFLIGFCDWLEDNADYATVSQKKLIHRLTDHSFAFAAGLALSLSHETLRRRSLNYAKEIWYVASARLQAMKTALNKADPDTDSVQESVKVLEKQIGEITRYLQVDLAGLGNVDGAAGARVHELNRLAALLQSRIKKLQVSD